jgi:hypothetical protein
MFPLYNPKIVDTKTLRLHVVLDMQVYKSWSLMLRDEHR